VIQVVALRLAVLFSLLFCFALKTQAQLSSEFTPFGVDTLDKVRSIRSLRTHYETIFGSLPKEYEKHYKELYENLLDYHEHEINHNYYSFEPKVVRYLNRILEEIISKNPGLKDIGVRLLVARSSVPNASAYPDQHVVVHLGLVSAMKNESQVAAVICHELAHLKMKHSHQAIKKHFDALYSKEGKRKIKEISRSGDDSYARAEQYLEELETSRTRHSRHYEAEADSLALVYLRNTGYAPQEMIDMLHILDEVDSLRFTPKFDLVRVFGFEGYPFKKGWLEEEQVLFGKAKSVAAQNWENDSIKTHPDCALRAATTLRQLGQQKGGKVNLQGDELFEQVKLFAQYEMVAANAELHNVEFSLFEALNLLKEKPKDAYLHGMVGLQLNTIFSAVKSHRLSEVVLLPRRDLPSEFLPFVRFLNQITMSDAAQLSYRYLDRQEAVCLQNELFLFAKLQAAKNCGRTAEFATLKEAYRKNFPKGKYKENIANL
jgi:Zn-dependent protease with chaperone function